jgi:hypothetical protein
MKSELANKIFISRVSKDEISYTLFALKKFLTQILPCHTTMAATCIGAIYMAARR